MFETKTLTSSRILKTFHHRFLPEKQFSKKNYVIHHKSLFKDFSNTFYSIFFKHIIYCKFKYEWTVVNNTSTREGRFGSKVGQIGPQIGLIRDFFMSDFSTFGTIWPISEPNLPSLFLTDIGTDWDLVGPNVTINTCMRLFVWSVFSYILIYLNKSKNRTISCTVYYYGTQSRTRKKNRVYTFPKGIMRVSLSGFELATSWYRYKCPNH